MAKGHENLIHGHGRNKGSKNKTQMTKAIRQDIFETYEELGGKDYLAVVATEDPKTFCNLLTKLIPQELRAEIGRPGDFENLTDKQLDEIIMLKMVEKYGDRFPQLRGLVGGEGVERLHQEPDPVHEKDVIDLRSGTAPLPDSQCS
jgi:hypothetical protein